MLDFTNRDLFTPFTHPESGVTFHVLTHRIAQVQKGFYFVNDSMSADGRYLFCRFPAQRWSPGTGAWAADTVEYDSAGLLASKRDGSDVLPRTFFERPLLQSQGELLYADYRVQYALSDGTIPAKNGTHLMVSADNGRTFKRRSTIAADPAGQDIYGEPQLAHTADGRLVCVIRKADQDQKPMSIAWSSDNGFTWTPVRDLFEFGVWPCVMLLGCGAMVLSYGRPGVHVRVDTTGTGENWGGPHTLIAGDPENLGGYSCSYTSLLPLDATSFLIAYSDFQHLDAEGLQRKAILVRTCTLESMQQD